MVQPTRLKELRVSARRLISSLLLLTVLVGCGGGSKTAAPKATVDPQVAITQAWETFFNAAGTVDAHVALLEDGATFKDQLTAAANSPDSKGLSAKVVKVEVVGQSATVTYNLLKGATALLTSATGTALEVKGVWKVSKATYCQLARLQTGGVVKGCA